MQSTMETETNCFPLRELTNIRVTSPHNTKVTQLIVGELCRQGHRGGFDKAAVLRNFTI